MLGGMCVKSICQSSPGKTTPELVWVKGRRESEDPLWEVLVQVEHSWAVVSRKAERQV